MVYRSIKPGAPLRGVVAGAAVPVHLGGRSTAGLVIL